MHYGSIHSNIIKMKIKWISDGDLLSVTPDTKENRSAACNIVSRIRSGILKGGTVVPVSVRIDDSEATVVVVPVQETVPCRSQWPNYSTECNWSHYWEDRVKHVFGYETCYGGDITVRECKEGELHDWFGPRERKGRRPCTIRRTSCTIP